VTSDGIQPYFAMIWKGRRGNTLHREAGEEATGARTIGRRFMQGRLLALFPRGVTTEEAERPAHIDIVKGRSKHKFTHHPNSSHDTPATPQDMVTISKMGPMIVVGLQ
jgi:hypothetical protein